MQNTAINYKYNIKSKIASLLDKKEMTIQIIINKSKITRVTLYRYWNLKKGEKGSAPVDFMKVVADELNTTIDELVN